MVVLSRTWIHDCIIGQRLNTLLAACPLLSAALLCVCHTTPAGIGLCWVALIPFGLAMANSRLPRSAYAAAYLAGLSVHLVGMSWVLDCYRYDNLWGPYLFQWFWIGTYGGVLLVIALAVGRWLVRCWTLPFTILLPCLWVAMEFVRHQTAGVVIGIDFPWLKLGMVLVEYPRLLQMADLGGEFLLSFFVSLINGALLDVLLAWSRGKSLPLTRQLSYPAAALALLAAASAYGQWRLSQSTFAEGPTVCLLGELDLPPILPHERLQTAFREQGVAEHLLHADLLVWPELAYHRPIVDEESDTGSVANNDIARRHLAQTARSLQATLVIGCEHLVHKMAASSRYNSLACSDHAEGFQGCYDKRRLVPAAETSPGQQNNGLFYTAGEGVTVFRTTTPGGVYRFGTSICYDLCFSDHFREMRADETIDFFVQSGAEGQDRDDVVADRMLRFARLRAVENRRPLVRNVTLGHSVLIDGNGIVRQALPPEPILSPTWFGAIPLDRRSSFYAFAGDWIAHLSGATIALMGLVVSGHERKRSANV